MARFDPNTYPDRLAFEATARRIRAEEIAKVFAALAALLDRGQRELASRTWRFARGVEPLPHRQSTH
jgi:hypothetical protein